MEGNNNIPAGWYNEVHDMRERLRQINQMIANQGNVSSNPQNSQPQNPPRHPDNIRDTGSPRRNTRSRRRNTRSPRRNNGGKTRKRKSRKNKNK